MAKSILAQMTEGQIVIDQAGQTITAELPEFFPTDKAVIMDEGKLVEYLQERGWLLNALHAGYKGAIIDFRAKYRKTDKESGAARKLTEVEIGKVHETTRSYAPQLFGESKVNKGDEAAIKTALTMAIYMDSVGMPMDKIEEAMTKTGLKVDQQQHVIQQVKDLHK
jgi:hypothetical protein